MIEKTCVADMLRNLNSQFVRCISEILCPPRNREARGASGGGGCGGGADGLLRYHQRQEFGWYQSFKLPF